MSEQTPSAVPRQVSEEPARMVQRVRGTFRIELRQFVRELIGDAWAPHIADSGTHTGSGGAGWLLTRYFSLYHSPTGHAHADPALPQ